MSLPQPLHIFRKDLTHLWPETLFVLALFAGFAFAAPSAWEGTQYAVYATIASWLLKVLMPLSWLILIARAIQDESLVGDRQFWTSRPYHWAKLLAAKALFIFVCIYIPFLIMQMYLLKRAGLHPLMVVPGLLHNLLLLTVVVVLPLAALSAVTSTFPRVLLSFLGAIVYIVILLAIVGWITFNQMQFPHLDWLLDAICILLPAAALLIQYRTRKTFIARTLLIATPILVAAIVLAAPSNALIAKAYPPLQGTTAPTLTPLTDRFPTPPPAAGDLLLVRNDVSISLPIGVTGMQKDVNVLGRGTRATITGPGFSYTSPFLTPFGPPPQFSSARPFTGITFSLPVAVFNKIHQQPIDLHLQFAAEILKADKPSTWKATILPFSVPGNGICSFPHDGPDAAEAPPTCRFPLSQPETAFVTAPLAAASCETPAAPPVTGQAILRGSGMSFDIDPVITVPLTFQTGDPDPQHNYVLCPGTALTFVQGAKLPNASLLFDQKQIVLDPFATRIRERSTREPRNGPGTQPPTNPDLYSFQG